MTIYDISKAAGVSIATVSRVINGSDAVSEKTRRKVLAVIQNSNYTPNAFARGLGLKSMKTIGLCCADIADPFIAVSLATIESRLRDNGYDLMLFCTGFDYETRKRSVQMLLSKHLDGVIFVGSHYVENERERNNYVVEVAGKVPVVLIHGVMEAENVYCVCCDDRRAMQMATRYLLERGSRRILYLYNAETYASARKRDGHSDTMASAGLAPLLCKCGGRSNTLQNVEEIKAFLKEAEPIDGILCETDTLAVSAVKYAHSCGLRIPQDVQIIGYNNSGLCLNTTPEITSVNSMQDALCRDCVSTLIAVLNGETRPKRSIFSAAIEARGSTK